MGKASTKSAAARGDWGPRGEWRFDLIQPIAATAMKSGTIRSPDRQIARSPDRQDSMQPCACCREGGEVVLPVE